MINNFFISINLNLNNFANTFIYIVFKKKCILLIKLVVLLGRAEYINFMYGRLAHNFRYYCEWRACFYRKADNNLWIKCTSNPLLMLGRVQSGQFDRFVPLSLLDHLRHYLNHRLLYPEREIRLFPCSQHVPLCVIAPK